VLMRAGIRPRKRCPASPEPLPRRSLPARSTSSAAQVESLNTIAFLRFHTELPSFCSGQSHFHVVVDRAVFSQHMQALRKLFRC
jgi:hypothetical protein